MWTCTECGETHEDSFDACWKCGNARDQTALAEEPGDPPGDIASCMKCGGAMEAGVLVDGHKSPTIWYAGAFASIHFSSLTARKFYLAANRCSDCGYLELYANT
jgi:hypothetical protein